MNLTAIVLWLVIGAVAGWLAGQLMRGRGLGLVGNIVVGIIGAFVGGWLLGGVLGISIGGGLVGAILNATVGAVVVLAVIGAIKRA
ncbi:MAG: GlsB/YeaQ/YmgE family stress response membrane protein [Rhodanobacteraceae bacterium]|nr:GlsB/YeaQ/YmgE family stress response membrane protein [Rhodanobacteraceae bacterium]